MKIEVLKYIWLLLLILLSCKPSKDIIIVWELVDSFEEKKDSCLFRTNVNGDTTIFEYDFLFDNFTNPLIFKILKDSSLIIDRNEFLKPNEIIKSYVMERPIEILRYDFPDSPPGGQGCWLFNFDLGMLGNGLYVGGKLIMKKYGDLVFDTDSIAELMKYQFKAPPPPPPFHHEKFWTDSLSVSELEEIEK